jgi:hypothetical protein
MGTVSQLSRPVASPLRILEVVGNVASEMQTNDRPGPETVAPGSMQFLIRSTRSVIDHYRQVLADHQMSEAEQKVVQVRLAEQERFLRDLLGVQEKQAIPGQGRLQAA